MRRFGVLCSPALFCLLLCGRLAAADELGRELNWSSPGAANYVRGQLPETVEPFKLPPVQALNPASGSLPLSGNPSIEVLAIHIDGVTALDSKELAELTEPYLNRNVSIEELQALRLALSNLYLERGYINSGVVIPDQRVHNGVVRMQAIEGVLSGIEIQGEARLRDAYIEPRILRYIEGPLNLLDIQKALQHLQRDDNVARLDARLMPGTALGQSMLQISVEEDKRISAGLSADNHNSTSIGEIRARVFVSSRNLSGLGEVLHLSGSLSDGADDFSVNFEVPLSRYNTRFQAYYARSDAKIVEQAFSALDIQSLTDTWGVSLTQPLIDGPTHSVSATLGLEVKHSETKLLGIPFSFSPGALDGESDTSALQLGLDWTRRGTNHVLGLRGTYRVGLDMLGATIFEPSSDLDRLGNPTGVDGRFDLFLGQGLFIYRLNTLPLFADLNERAQLVTRTTLQLAFDPLMSIEKIAIGGVNTLRGVPENLLVRDNGFAATVELQLPIPGYQADAHPLNLVIAPFIDYGRSWDEKDISPLSDVRDTNHTRHILSAGLGLIWQPVNGLRASLYWGEDLDNNFNGDDPRATDPGDDLQNDGLHISISYIRSF